MISEYIQLFVSDHVLFFFFGVFIPCISIIAGKPELEDLEFSGKNKIRAFYSNSFLQWVSVFVLTSCWLFHDRSLGSLGFKMPIINDTVIWISVTTIWLYFADLAYETLWPGQKEITIKRLEKSAAFIPVNLREYKHFIFAGLTAGICEEIIFRGFMVNYLLSLLDYHLVGKMSALVLPALLFGLLHIYQGHRSVFKIVIGAFLLSLIYYFSGSLLIPILIHIVVDCLSAYVIMRLLSNHSVVQTNQEDK